MEQFISIEDQNELLRVQNLKLQTEIKDLKERLEKYTNNAGHKKYKENNKGKIQEYQREYQKTYYEKKKKTNNTDTRLE